MMMKLINVTVSMFLLLVLSSACAVKQGAGQDDNTLLALIFKQAVPDGKYTIVDPEARLPDNHDKAYLLEQFKTDDAIVGPLIDQLIERNAEPVLLTLESSPENGYVVDYDGAYAQYFKEDGGGWDKLYEEHPDASGSTTVSLPAYDEASGYVLIYKATQLHWLAGSGNLILYKYADGKMTEVENIMLWIS